MVLNRQVGVDDRETGTPTPLKLLLGSIAWMSLLVHMMEVQLLP